MLKNQNNGLIASNDNLKFCIKLKNCYFKKLTFVIN